MYCDPLRASETGSLTVIPEAAGECGMQAWAGICLSLGGWTIGPGPGGLRLKLERSLWPSDLDLEACSDSEVASEFSVLLRRGRRRQ